MMYGQPVQILTTDTEHTENSLHLVYIHVARQENWLPGEIHYENNYKIDTYSCVNSHHNQTPILDETQAV